MDIRAKDALPISINAQDNMLHVDNSPFFEEFKILLTWEKGKYAGPNGQCFTYLPSTHKLVRNCNVGPDGRAYTTENRSIFVTKKSVETLCTRQIEILCRTRGTTAPKVVEVKYPASPVMTIFPASSLVHHRYRTETSGPRSSLMVAFHPVKQNPGKFLNSIDRDDVFAETLLARSLISESEFLESFSTVAETIGHSLLELESDMARDNRLKVIDADTLVMGEKELIEWKGRVVNAPRIETFTSQKPFPLGEIMSRSAILNLIVARMVLDKHAPLNLPLYEDFKEELRKDARVAIREMKADQLATRLSAWERSIRQPTSDEILSGDEFQRALLTLSDLSGSREVAYKQLANDLAYSIRDCESVQTLLTTFLFGFWVAEFLWTQLPDVSEIIWNLGSRLLNNYFSMTIFVEKTELTSKQGEGK
eukprot:TRINITY_DN6443_c0_g1_i2.p1 TRINITY_DN6443_c0_g1~~TRINITY_DN6443_c0_g1_i2.p1  ORF type:complete len:489 (+),score=75.60 TRINITY_DN6443_c0_g1_i2:203-1468(+)